MRNAVVLFILLVTTGALASAQATAPAPVASEVLAVQVMLDRAGFSPGELDGRAGQNLRRALRAFQRASGLPPSGTADDATRQALERRRGPQPPLREYEVTAADAEGPFAGVIPDDLMAQAGLPALSYRNPLEKIAERFHASPRLLRELNPKASFAPGERIVVPDVEPFEVPSRGGRGAARGRGRAGAAQGAPGEQAVGTSGADVTVIVSRSAGSLSVEDASGQVILHAPVTSGSAHDPLPIGEWKVTGVHPMPPFNYNPELFWDADPAHSKAKIAPGPNNPVGVAWIDIDKEHYGIHGTPEPGQVGHTQSHGCVRLTNWDVARLLTLVSPGTRVVFRE
jgi:lipoprotein-anchoring transpeptidase ErfK/SrfK